MARNLDTRRPTSEFADHALPRAGALSWPTLASAIVASTLVVALAVSFFALIEAVFFNPASKLPQRSVAQTDSHGWRASGLQPVLYSPVCLQVEPATCGLD
jgi:hypothetical protein